MNEKYLKLNRLFDDTVSKIKSDSEYKRFLETAAHNFRFGFRNAVVAFSQNTGSNLLLPYEQWQIYGRVPKRYSKRILLFDRLNNGRYIVVDKITALQHFRHLLGVFNVFSVRQIDDRLLGNIVFYDHAGEVADQYAGIPEGGQILFLLIQPNVRPAGAGCFKIPHFFVGHQSCFDEVPEHQRVWPHQKVKLRMAVCKSKEKILVLQERGPAPYGVRCPAGRIDGAK